MHKELIIFFLSVVVRKSGKKFPENILSASDSFWYANYRVILTFNVVHKSASGIMLIKMISKVHTLEIVEYFPTVVTNYINKENTVK